MDDLKNQSNDADFFDDMDKFAEMCARRLEEEHARIAAEKENAPAPTIFPEDVEEESQAAESPEQESTSAANEGSEAVELPDEKPLQVEQAEVEQNSPETVAEEQNVNEANSDIRENTDRVNSGEATSAPTAVAVLPTDAVREERASAKCDDDTMPLWTRVLFSAILAVLGAVGVWMLISNTSASYFLDALCFIEVAMCLITGVGINASGIADRGRKMTVMRTALWVMFLFYCLYTADSLFLHRAMETKFAIADFAEYARTHISFDLIGGLTKMSGWGTFECAFYVMPYAFCVPVLVKSYRNIILYFLYMTFSFLAVSTLRIVTMTGDASLAQCLVCLIGAAVTYIVVMLPPVQDMLRRVGLLEWVELKEDED